MKKLLECIPNFSEGRDVDKIDKIVAAFRNKGRVRLLDYKSDHDHNRLVITIIGEPEPLSHALIEAIGTAVDLIDMRRHKGGHPRMGAVDVVPFVPILETTMNEAVTVSRQLAKEISEKYHLPVFLYEESATRPNRKNLANIRKGEFEGMPSKIATPEWSPDFGPPRIHPTAGVTAVGARMPLIAFNVNLDTSDLEIARKIAERVRHSSGGLPHCKALGIQLKERGIVQVSMNMTNYTKTPLYAAFELIKEEAIKYNVDIAGSQIIGLAPMEALLDAAAYYLDIEDFAMEQHVLESRIME